MYFFFFHFIKIISSILFCYDEALEVNYTKTRTIAFFFAFPFTRCACAVERGK